MYAFDRSSLNTGPCPPITPAGCLVVTMVPPRDRLRQQLRVILYYRLGAEVWVVKHADVVTSDFMAATCEQQALVAAPPPAELNRGWRVPVSLLAVIWLVAVAVFALIKCPVPR